MFNISEFYKRQSLNGHIIILEMKIVDNTNQLYIRLMSGEKQHLFTLKMHEIGTTLPSELESIITINIETCRAFAKLIEEFREGKQINFPIKIN